MSVREGGGARGTRGRYVRRNVDFKWLPRRLSGAGGKAEEACSEQVDYKACA